MSRLKKGALPASRLYKRTGQAVVIFNGHDHYLGPYGSPSSKQKYADLIRSWQQRAERLAWCDWTILVTSVPLALLAPAEAVVNVPSPLASGRWQAGDQAALRVGVVLGAELVEHPAAVVTAGLVVLVAESVGGGGLGAFAGIASETSLALAEGCHLSARLDCPDAP